MVNGSGLRLPFWPFVGFMVGVCTWVAWIVAGLVGDQGPFLEYIFIGALGAAVGGWAASGHPTPEREDLLRYGWATFYGLAAASAVSYFGAQA